MDDLKKNFQYFLDNKGGLVKKYGGMYIVIVNCEVVGSFTDENDAYYDSVEKYGLGNFIIQLCTENEEEYTETYHSRVVFV
jgi:hypothetical protein